MRPVARQKVAGTEARREVERADAEAREALPDGVLGHEVVRPELRCLGDDDGREWNPVRPKGVADRGERAERPVTVGLRGRVGVERAVEGVRTAGGVGRDGPDPAVEAAVAVQPRQRPGGAVLDGLERALAERRRRRLGGLCLGRGDGDRLALGVEVVEAPHDDDLRERVVAEARLDGAAVVGRGPAEHGRVGDAHAGERREAPGERRLGRDAQPHRHRVADEQHGRAGRVALGRVGPRRVARHRDARAVGLAGRAGLELPRGAGPIGERPVLEQAHVCAGRHDARHRELHERLEGEQQPRQNGGVDGDEAERAADHVEAGGAGRHRLAVGASSKRPPRRAASGD